MPRHRSDKKIILIPQSSRGSPLPLMHLLSPILRRNLLSRLPRKRHRQAPCEFTHARAWDHRKIASTKRQLSLSLSRGPTRTKKPNQPGRMRIEPRDKGVSRVIGLTLARVNGRARARASAAAAQESIYSFSLRALLLFVLRALLQPTSCRARERICAVLFPGKSLIFPLEARALCGFFCAERRGKGFKDTARLSANVCPTCRRLFREIREQTLFCSR